MARGQRKGIGCGTILLLLLVVLAIGAWRFGLFERALYLMQVDSERFGQSESSEGFEHTELNDLGVDDEGGGEGENAASEGPLATGYVYSQLDEADREKYLVLLDTFQTREERAYPETDLDDLSRIRDCVIADHPELFYVNGVQMQTTTNSVSGLVVDVTVDGQYSLSAEEAEALRPQIEAAAAACVAGLPEGADDYVKAKHFYEYLVTNVEYDRSIVLDDEGTGNSMSGQTVVDALVRGKAVCAGYARAYQYLLQQTGVPCVLVTGMARNENHAWCAAYLDGDWYCVDPTWGDPQFLNEDGNDADFGLVNYDYLCVTDDDLASTHVADRTYPLPECTAIADNYFVREDLYLTEADVDEAGAIVKAAVSRGDVAARFRCSDDHVYNKIVDALFEGQEIYRFIPGFSCRYILDGDMRTVVVLFE